MSVTSPTLIDGPAGALVVGLRRRGRRSSLAVVAVVVAAAACEQRERRDQRGKQREPEQRTMSHLTEPYREGRVRNPPLPRPYSCLTTSRSSPEAPAPCTTILPLTICLWIAATWSFRAGAIRFEILP